MQLGISVVSGNYFIVIQGHLTPLHYAASKGHTDSISLLVASVADVNVKDNVSSLLQ